MLLKRLALVILVGCLTQGLASAGTVTVEYTGSTGYFQAHYGGSGGSGGTAVNTYAGDFLITVTDSTGLESLPTSFYTFCVDLQHYTQSPTDATLGSMAGWSLFGGVQSYQLLGASYLANQYFALFPTGASDAIAASYQVAIWELLYEREGNTPAFSTWNVASGTTYFSNAFDSETLIRNIDTTSWMYTYAGQLETLNNRDGYTQDFVTPVPDGGVTLLLLGGALLGIGALRRKFSA